MQRLSLRLSVAPGLVACALIILALAGCTTPPVIPGPTQPPPGPVEDLSATATAQTAGLIATQTAVSAAVAEVAQAQATLTAQAAQPTRAEEAQPVAAATTSASPELAAQQATATAQARAIAARQGMATALAAGTPTPLPTATPVPTPSSTPTSSQAACVAVDPVLASIAADAETAGLGAGCPIAPAQAVDGAVQEYWSDVTNPNSQTHLRGVMIWRGDRREIYATQRGATSATQRLLVYPDRYQDGSPEVEPACANMQPPSGYLLPVRGFGKVWCDNSLAQVLGWPNAKEAAARLWIQPTRNGLLLKASAPDAGVGSLLAANFQTARAISRETLP